MVCLAPVAKRGGLCPVVCHSSKLLRYACHRALQIAWQPHPFRLLPCGLHLSFHFRFIPGFKIARLSRRFARRTSPGSHAIADRTCVATAPDQGHIVSALLLSNRYVQSTFHCHFLRSHVCHTCAACPIYVSGSPLILPSKAVRRGMPRLLLTMISTAAILSS